MPLVEPVTTAVLDVKVMIYSVQAWAPGIILREG
jgi:hypothetical protein